MDEARTIIDECYRLAKILEENLPANNMANHHYSDHILASCDEIIRIFTKAKDTISKRDDHNNTIMPVPSASGVQQWLQSSSHTPAMDLLNVAHPLGPVFPAGDAKMKGVVRYEAQEASAAAGGTLAEVVGTRSLLGSGGSGDHGGGAASSGPRQRRRSDNGGFRRVVRVPAPQMGNTEIPPEDGHTWRKYGQKVILNSSFPRSYFRCTHQKLYNCPAKKQVQRLNDDPNSFEITYRGDHTCHYSSTAPSAAPPPPPPPPPPPSHPHQQLITQQDHVNAIHHQQQLQQQQLHGLDLTPAPAPAFLMSQWLSMGTGGRDVASHIINLGAGPSTSRTAFGEEPGNVEYLQPPQQPVADMADAMFNSGSSSNNSMDLIFSSMDNKWDSGENKNESNSSH